MNKNPLKGYYLTRVYKGDDPFMTIMDLFREDAIAMCRKKTPYRRANMRKDDDPIAAYYDERLATENWLRENARTAGVDIKAQHPIYFALATKPEPADSGRNAVSIPAEEVDLSNCSFTFDDSFINYACVEKRAYDSEEHPLRGVVLNAEQAAAAVKKFGLLGTYDKGSRYVEVQMWSRPSIDALPQVRPQLPKTRVKR
jgi:hypothetical protein